MGVGIERVELERVTKRFGATLALRGVTLSLDASRVNLVVGANGSGKSTLLNILGTTSLATSGEVKYLPDPGSLQCVRREIGWVGHETLAYADLSGRKNIELAASLYGLNGREAWERLAERFALGAFATRPLRTNSRGQRQRIALARAMVNSPTLVLLDEPTAGLDSVGVEQLLGLVADRVEQRALVVVIAHDPEVFSAFGCRHVRLDKGRLVDDGSA